MRNLFTKFCFAILFAIVSLFAAKTAYSQVPDAINFQAIARDASGEVMGNTQIMIQLTILDGSAEGPQVYREIRSLMTNAYGSFAFQMGRDPHINQGEFADIDWANGAKFMKVDYDPTASLSFNLTLGTIEFVTVPYAFTARDVVYIDATGAVNGDVLVFNEATGKFEPGQVNAANVTWDNIEGKPDFKEVATTGDYEDLINTPTLFSGNYDDLQGKPELNIANWNTAYSWGNHSGLYRPIAWVPAWNEVTDRPTDLNDFTNNAGYLKIETQNLTNVLSISNSASSQNITDLANPVNAQDAATKSYVDQLISLFEANGMVVVDFSASATNIMLGNSVSFTDNSILEATQWQWDFGDGQTSTEQNPAHIYENEGTYTVTLTASNGILSSSKTKNDYIVVTDGPTYGTFTDSRDGYTYQTVHIGSQTWMAENLAYKPSSGNYWAYNNDDSYIATYGYLYDWNTAMNGATSSNENPSGVQGICPAGWHLPSDAEWQQLEMYLGMSPEQANEAGWRGNDEGGKLKEAGCDHWQSPNEGANNESGFTALPGGYYLNGYFFSIGNYGYWWSATEYDTDNAWYRSLRYGYSSVIRFYDTKSLGFSVRCVRDN
ncbi:MAG TPA: FISUMP domain-containing protein [Bacteroidales bacterium]|nr:FISUMP domain-containing protein [Bacteroidales bacterium]HQB21823.1 FISUMP domain-containing protein [Bacteroidales bacterium]